MHGLVRSVGEGREVRPKAVASAVTVDLATGTHEAVPVTMSKGTGYRPETRHTDTGPGW